LTKDGFEYILTYQNVTQYNMFYVIYYNIKLFQNINAD